MFLYSNDSPVTFSDALPSSVDVVIIGGGVIGITTAWYLLEKGVSVLVCDKGRVAGEQSSRNWGWVRVTERDHDEVPIAMDSVRRWKAISEQLDEDIGFTQQGVLALASSEKEMAEYEAWRDFAALQNLDTKLFTAAELEQHIQVPNAGWCGGMLTPSDGRAEPFKAVPAIARGVQKRGGLVRENCAVRTIETQGGCCTGVVTESGTVKTQSVVCAAGAWSTMFLSNIGVSLPQLAVRGTVVRTTKAPEVFGGAAGLGDIFIRRRQDGGYTVASDFTDHTIGANSLRFLHKFIPSMRESGDVGICMGIGNDRDVTQQPIPAKRWNGDESSPFEQNRVLNPQPSEAGLRKIRHNLDKRIPKLRGIEFEQSWAGMIDATPDVVPVMDSVASIPGLFLATGFSGHGFGIGPGAGHVMASLVTNREVPFDLSRFRFSRFSDGSRMRPGPAL